MTLFENASERLRHTDPLLRVTKVLLYGLMVVACIVAFAMVVAIPGLWFVPNTVIVNEARLTRDSFVAVTAVLAIILAGAILAIQFLRQIIAIIDSVKLGSPFVPENARRLRIAAWIVVAAEGLILLLGAMSDWIRSKVPDSEVDFEFSVGWLITALLLFILARVFDHGTRLAEDVEGTV